MDAGNNTKRLTTLCQVVYATLGLIRPSPMLHSLFCATIGIAGHPADRGVF
jgi:hypothetical protein